MDYFSDPPFPHVDLPRPKHPTNDAIAEARPVATTKVARTNILKTNLIARLIYAMRRKEDTGFGDTIARVFSLFGSSAFKWVFRQLRIDCGCANRQAALNAWFP